MGMNILAIYGAGGLGREVLEIAQQINNLQVQWDEVIFVDDFKFGNIVKKSKVVTFDTLMELAKHREKSLSLVIANGDPINRKKIFERLSVNNLGEYLVPIVSPQARVASSAKVGVGTIICPGVHVSVDVSISSNCLINVNSIVGHDVTIENDSVISSQVNLGGNVKVLAGVFIGMGTTVREGITVGSRSIIGMGSSVHKSVPPGVLFLGNPARAMRKVEQVTLYKNNSG